ncbi:MAG: YbfB/YjiJ family MFS transporter [Burkholderiales bacterium]|nr:YbfB/YjiJ family MFS transporter [Burkholderiales bacterium]
MVRPGRGLLTTDRMQGQGRSAASAAKPPSAASAALAGAAMMAAAMGIGRFAYTPLLPSLQETLGWSVSQAGDAASANFLGYMLGAFVAAELAHRPARRLWLAAGMIASALSTAAGAVVVAFAAWLGIRFLSGVASAFCLVLGTAAVVEHIALRGRAELAALHFGGVGLGIVGSVVVIELARVAGASMFAQWGALGVAATLLLAGAWRALGRLPLRLRAAAPGGALERHAAYDARTLRRLILAYGLFGFGYVVTATFIVAIARQLEHAAVVEPVTWIAVGLFAAPSVLVWQGIARRFGLLRTLRIAYAVEAAGVLLAGVTPGYLAIVLGGALLGGTFVGITALGLAAGREASGSNQGRVMGLMTGSFGLGQLLGPAIAGRLADATGGFVVPSLLAASLLIVGIVLLHGLTLPQGRSEPETASGDA